MGPDGKYLAGPVLDKEEIIYGEIDLEKIIPERGFIDITGHYNRPDVFTLYVKGEQVYPKIDL